jgi:hypothetical protein
MHEGTSNIQSNIKERISERNKMRIYLCDQAPRLTPVIPATAEAEIKKKSY